MAKLTDGQVRALLGEMVGWTHVAGGIHKSFSFPGFKSAMAFVNRVAERAIAAGHHPDLEIHYNRVVVSLSTHDEGGVTDKDVALAAQIDAAARPAGD